MSLRISEAPLTALAEYATIPIAFEVRSVLELDGTERALDAPYPKDYGAPTPFDGAKWGLLLAHMDEQLVGGALIACDTPSVTMLEGRSDLAVLWDIRITPQSRGRGIGAALFRTVEQWAIARHCTELKIETQNTNVPACRFYARQGCVLRAMHAGVYAELPHEIQMLWYKTL